MFVNRACITFCERLHLRIDLAILATLSLVADAIEASLKHRSYFTDTCNRYRSTVCVFWMALRGDYANADESD